MKFFIAILALVSQGAYAQSPKNQQILLTTTNTVVYRGEVSDGSALDIQLKLFKLVLIRGKKDYPLYLVLDSPGGSIEAGLGFIEFAKTIRNLKTVSIFAASMASAIAEGLPGDRYVTQNGTMMFHRAQGAFRGYFESGEVETQLATSKSIVQYMETTNANRMKLTLPVYKELVRSELWLFSTASVVNNAADKVVDLVCSANLIDTKESLTVETMFGSLVVTFSGCPLFRYPTGVNSDKYLVSSLENFRLQKKLLEAK